MAKKTKNVVNEDSISEGKQETPLMKQYNTIKAKYPDALLLFRVGDFYETFGADAIKVSGILGIVLTKRNNGSATFIELAGFPYHSLDTYLPKLVRAGNRVAICDQLEDPKLTKTIVKRGVTELVTPGVSYNDKTIDLSSNNFLCAVYFQKSNSTNLQNDFAGISFLDVSTGEFYLAEGKVNYISNLLKVFKPNEILFSKSQKNLLPSVNNDSSYSYALDDWIFADDYSKEILLKHFQTLSLKGFGVEDYTLGKIAAGVALHYLNETAHDKVKHITKLNRIEEDKYVWLDKFTIRNLELISSSQENAKTLLSVIDNTITPMGSRLMRRWLIMPLKDSKPIEERLMWVQFFLDNPELSLSLSNTLKQCGDLERLISKTAMGKIGPREINQIKITLNNIAKLKIDFKPHCVHPYIVRCIEQLNPCEYIANRIDKEIKEDPPAVVTKGDVIASGVSAQLDEIREIMGKGKDYLLQIQKREIEATGITNLKISFNSVFGYFLEVTNSYKSKVPETWIRKQTLANAERYITEELKEYEEKILNAESTIQGLELSLYNNLIEDLMTYIGPIQTNAGVVSMLDCLLCFSNNAKHYGYVKPQLSQENTLNIRAGRHPVIEQLMPPGESFISNDIFIDNSTQQIIMITGPNMSGKSALLRQTALIVILAQCGSFVPAAQAEIGLVDKIFTRVGASDNISSGESTFMVEMNETASILNNVSPRSLVLLDEIGRGTSTYDGISIAWAIAEHLHETIGSQCRTLFATHYHELNEMAESFSRIKNFTVAVKETKNSVVFLRKLIPGGSEHSFGIHVAKMAGMPIGLIKRAEEILKTLEQTRTKKDSHKKHDKKINDLQLSFFQLDDPVLSQIREQLSNLDVNTLTPVEALFKLHEIKKIL
jgi:DNA mismatch repair protein MutS